MSRLDRLEKIARTVGDTQRSRDLNVTVDREQIEHFEYEAHHDEFLKQRVGSFDQRPESIRFGGEYLHATSLLDFCPRAHALVEGFEDFPGLEQTPRSCDRLVWALGREAEKHVRDSLAQTMPDLALGSWRCLCGNTSHVGTLRDVLNNSEMHTCAKCERDPIYYEELEWVDDVAKVVGHSDFVYVLPDSTKLRIVEIKSINKRDFEKLTTPQAAHRLQAGIYQQLMRHNMGDDMVDEKVTIFYVCKDYVQGSPYKEYHVPMLAHHTAAIENGFDLARQRANRNAGAGLPPRLSACAKSTNPKAAGCALCGVCHSTNK
jgi:hypothetical protein